MKTPTKRKPQFKEKDLIDIQILQAIKEGDANAFAKIVASYKEKSYYRILRYVNFNKDEADDLLQEFFYRLYKNHKKYKKEYTFNTWSIRMLDNMMIDYFRLNKRSVSNMNSVSLNKLVTEDDGNQVEMIDRLHKLPVKNLGDVQHDGQGEIEKKDMYRVLYKLIGRLDPEERRILKMFYFKGFLIREICKKYKMPEGTVKVTLFRAKAKLKALILEYEPGYQYLVA